MISILLYVLAGSFLLNLFIVVFGKRDIEALKRKMSIGKYLREVNDALVDEIGDAWVTVIKVALFCLLAVFLLCNLLLAVLCVVAFAVGSLLAKKAYSVTFVNGILNKVACYVNRLRK